MFCRGNHCDIDVTVTSCSAADGISVSGDLIFILCKGDGPTKTINWRLPGRWPVQVPGRGD